MPKEKRDHPKVKTKLHPRNRHRGRYNFAELIKTLPALSSFVRENEYGDDSVDFFDPKAVKALNTAILKHYYKIDHWEIPDNYLSPPIPGRADYIHHVADLLAFNKTGTTDRKIPRGDKIICLDIGVGASCIYPIIGNHEYGWSFIGTEIDAVSLDSAKNIIESNPSLKGKVEFRMQENSDNIFDGIIKEGEFIDLSICNPPFHRSAEAANAVATRKLENLKRRKIDKPILNFGGQSNELWCKGGQETFVNTIIEQSQKYPTSCFWYSTMVSKQALIKNAFSVLEKSGAVEIKTIAMGQGNKSSRILAWTFLNKKQQKVWQEARFRK